MKVSKADAERDNAGLAMRLGFFRQARRVTLQSLADANGTQRSNLSAFVTSGGRTRNIAYDKLDRILFALGVLPDGTLAPGLHRWQIEPVMVDAMCEVLVANDCQDVVLMRLGSGGGAFLIARVTSNILVFASLDAGSIASVDEGLRQMADRVRTVVLDRSGDSSIQAMWMTPDDVRVEKLLLSILN